ncbi:MAG: hypothetical protein A2X36_14070 [Elusimicrobia bacterium GWA2_69_24]|nr:MAG: hypothetical protein A2X36_14070 [Elusimicrobia bacterium GWA2_69_24]HBL17293.1 hypothetical protein [Elusimicrobiota bacterium]
MTPQNEPPKIPSLKPVQKDEEKKSGSGPLAGTGKPATSTGFRFPGLGKGGLPNLRVRGLPSGTSVIDRLKNLRKKDMMFIFAGLAVLCMAPLAEHFMMSPEEEAGNLQEGFDSKGPLFPDGTTIYESGTGGFSPGGLVGAGTDVITPLNVRDPSALVMGPGATRKPEAVVAPPPAAPEKPEPATDWKHALAESAKSGTKAAVSKAKLPMPSVKMSGALRGLSAGGGGTSASLSLAGLSAGNVPSRAKDSNSLTTSKAAPGYRGASKRSTDMSTGAEGLKGAGSRQADILNRGGSAAGNLENASKETVPGGGGAGTGSGNPTKDADGKSPSHKKPDDNKSLGESLEYLRQKTEMQKALELKWKRKEWEEFGRGKMIEESVIKLALDNFLGKGIFEPIGKAIGKTFEQTMAGGTNPNLSCIATDANGVVQAGATPYSFPKSSVDGKDYQLMDNGLLKQYGTVIAKCSGDGQSGTPKPPGEEDPNAVENINNGPGGMAPKPNESAATTAKLNDMITQHCGATPTADKWGDGTTGICKSLTDMQKTGKDTFGGIEKNNEIAQQKVVEAYEKMKYVIALLNGGGDATSMKSIKAAYPHLFKGTGDKPFVLSKSKDSVTKLGEVEKCTDEATCKPIIDAAKELVSGDASSAKVALQSAVGATDPKAVDGALKGATDNIQLAVKGLTDAAAILVEAKTAVTKGQAGIKAADTELGAVGSGDLGGDGNYTDDRNKLVAEMNASRAKLNEALTTSDGLITAAKKVLDDQVDKGAVQKVYGDGKDGKGGLYSQVTAAGADAAKIVDTKFPAEFVPPKPDPVSGAVTGDVDPAVYYKKAAKEVITVLAGEGGTGEGASGGLMGTLAPKEQPIKDAVPVVEKAILEAKTAVDNKGGTATKGSVGTGTTQPK